MEDETIFHYRVVVTDDGYLYQCVEWPIEVVEPTREGAYEALKAAIELARQKNSMLYGEGMYTVAAMLLPVDATP